MKLFLEFGGQAAATLEELSQRLKLSPTATIYHALNVLHKAVIPSVVKAANGSAKRKTAQPAQQGSRRAVNANDVDKALAMVEEIQSLADDVPAEGEEFAVSVLEKVADIASTIEEHNRVTDRQMTVLENMRDGLQRWVHD